MVFKRKAPKTPAGSATGFNPPPRRRPPLPNSQPPKDDVEPVRPDKPKPRNEGGAAVMPPRLPASAAREPDKPGCQTLGAKGRSSPSTAKQKQAFIKPKRQPTGDYAVGNCRPPEHGKIKPGEVRNPRGRPPGALGLDTIWRKTMGTMVSVRTQAGERRMSRAEAAALKLTEQGFGDNVRALVAALASYGRAVPERREADKAEAAASLAEDEAVLAAFRALLTLGEQASPEDVDADDNGDDKEG